jgi:hypothetical protein
MCHSCLEALFVSRIATADAVDDSGRTHILSRITPRFHRMALDQQETTPAIAVRQWNEKAISMSGIVVQPTHGDVTAPSIDNDRIRLCPLAGGQSLNNILFARDICARYSTSLSGHHD